MVVNIRPECRRSIGEAFRRVTAPATALLHAKPETVGFLVFWHTEAEKARKLRDDADRAALAFPGTRTRKTFKYHWIVSSSTPKSPENQRGESGVAVTDHCRFAEPACCPGTRARSSCRPGRGGDPKKAFQQVRRMSTAAGRLELAHDTGVVTAMEMRCFRLPVRRMKDVEQWKGKVNRQESDSRWRLGLFSATTAAGKFKLPSE